MAEGFEVEGGLVDGGEGGREDLRTGAGWFRFGAVARAGPGEQAAAAATAAARRRSFLFGRDGRGVGIWVAHGFVPDAAVVRIGAEVDMGLVLREGVSGGGAVSVLGEEVGAGGRGVEGLGSEVVGLHDGGRLAGGGGGGGLWRALAWGAVVEVYFAGGGGRGGGRAGGRLLPASEHVQFSGRRTRGRGVVEMGVDVMAGGNAVCIWENIVGLSRKLRALVLTIPVCGSARGRGASAGRGTSAGFVRRHGRPRRLGQGGRRPWGPGLVALSKDT